MANLQEILGTRFKDGMTNDEIASAFSEIQEEERKKSASTESHYKALISERNAEAAKYKNELNEKRTEAERLEAERAEKLQSLQAEVEKLQKEKQLSEYTAKFASHGYDQDLAKANAEAFMNGDIDSLLKAQSQLIEGTETKIKSELMKDTPRPEGGAQGAHKMTKKELYSMPLEDRMRFYKEHPEEYKAINSES